MTDFHAHNGNTKHSNSPAAENDQDLSGITNNSPTEKSTASCVKELSCITSKGIGAVIVQNFQCTALYKDHVKIETFILLNYEPLGA